MVLTATVAAQPADVTASAATETDPAPPQQLGYGAMPGGLHAPSADTLPKGAFAITALGGYGVRNTLVSADDKLTRAIGDIAFAFAPSEMITLAVAFDGRYDKHSPTDDVGYVGDPRLLVRVANSFGNVRLGGQLGIWVPGKDAPSIVAGATSVDARGLLSVKAGPATISFNAGFRLDNSSKSVVDADGNDNRMSLSAEDRVSLGVSDFSAVVGGANLSVSQGKAFFGLEASTDVFVGSGAPGPIVRAGGRGGFHISPQWAVYAFVEGAKVPGIDYNEVVANNTVTLVPYEPVFTGGLVVQARFGGPHRGTAGDGSVVKKNDKPESVNVVEFAEISGQVTDENSKPIVGAKVTIKLKKNTATPVTDDKGRYSVKVQIGTTVDGKTDLDDTGAEVTIEVAGKKPSTSTLTLVKGANTIPVIALAPLLPPGTLKAQIRAAGTGKPIANATVKIEPGGMTATSDADGYISIDLPPGTYKATASGTGFKSQSLDVVIESGVVVKNFELPK
jgi:hypothetical protein